MASDRTSGRPERRQELDACPSEVGGILSVHDQRGYAPFTDPQVGGVTAFFKSLSAGNLASNLAALSMYMDSAPAALVAKKIEGNMRFAFGWTMATSKRHLAEIGGWKEMANYHSDDFELGKRIARCGQSW